MIETQTTPYITLATTRTAASGNPKGIGAFSPALRRLKRRYTGKAMKQVSKSEGFESKIYKEATAPENASLI